MSEHDLFKLNPRMPKRVRLGDITIRDGFQHEEDWIPTEAKIYYLQELAFAGVKRLEVTNLGNPRIMPQFRDAEEVLKGVHDEIFEKRLNKRGIKPEEIEWTAITIREPSVDRAIRLKEQGYGPDRVLMMVSTDEEHHFAKSGTTLPAYWAEAELLIFYQFDLQKVTPTSLQATVRGGYAPNLTKHIKAVTYHNLAIVKTEEGLEATVVFDV